jgi:acetyl-CoA synthetase
LPASQLNDRPSTQVDHHAAMYAGFGWCVPGHFNIAQACCARWTGQADSGERVAVFADGPGRVPATHSYAQLQQCANRLSNALVQRGVGRGDRVAVVLPQCFETAVAYIAVLQMGAVLMPLSMLFGPEALEFRLQDSAAVLAICDAGAMERVSAVRKRCPALRSLIRVAASNADSESDSEVLADYEVLMAAASTRFRAQATCAEDAAVLIYTSGTTGPPKGTLIAHRTLIGNLSGFICSQNWFGFDPADPRKPSAAVFWSPADWTWTGGLMDALLPTLYFGRPIVAWNGRFSPQIAFELLEKYAVTHSFLFPTALKAMMKAYPDPGRQFSLSLQAIMSAGEAVGDAVFDYCRKKLGLVVNEMFGQTEINYIVGNCAMNGDTRSGVGWPARPGSMGRPYPGHRVALIDEAGQECAIGQPGDVAVNRFDIHGHPDPVFFREYWNNPEATSGKFTGDWCRTGDLATRDADGYLWYQGRADDMFKAAGYRIGPGEIENCLVKHPAVMNAAVVPKPDRERGAVVKAYVVLSSVYLQQRENGTGTGNDFDATLVRQLQDHVRGKLAPYEYPKEIEFVSELPMTTTGKVQRRLLRLQEEARAARLSGRGSA